MAQNLSMNLIKGNLDMIDTDLNEALVDAVDSGLLVLGENSRKAIYSCLEKNFKIKREEVAPKFEEFKEALEDILGSGAEILKKIIIREIQTKLELNLEEKGNFEATNHVSTIQETHKSRRHNRRASGKAPV